MPAAAVIPAPIAYIKVVAVKTFVVEFVSHTGNGLTYGPQLLAIVVLVAACALVCGRFTGEWLRPLIYSRKPYMVLLTECHRGPVQLL